MAPKTTVTTERDTAPTQPDERWLRDVTGALVHDIGSKRPAVIEM
ncbi:MULTISPECIES: hypothetical protein [unclassified Haloarcula]|nr:MULTISPECIES: hypothetical protein [unclassified Haloarcula]